EHRIRIERAVGRDEGQGPRGGVGLGRMDHDRAKARRQRRRRDVDVEADAVVLVDHEGARDPLQRGRLVGRLELQLLRVVVELRPLGAVLLFEAGQHA
ncbi:hypothetical protein D0817_25950, partial [Flavobacterium cupreum]